MRLANGLALFTALVGCSSSSFDVGASAADSGGAFDSGTVQTDGVVVEDTAQPPDTCVAVPTTLLAHTTATTDATAVSRARAIAIGFNVPRAERLTAITLTIARQPYDCPEDVMSTTCKSHDPACPSCTVDSEGSCTCTASPGSEGKITAKVFSGTPGSGVLVGVAETNTASINTAPSVSSVRLEFSSTPALAVGNAYIELTTDASAAQFMLRGGAGAPVSLRLWLRYTFTGGGYLEFSPTAPRPAMVIESTACE